MRGTTTYMNYNTTLPRRECPRPSASFAALLLFVRALVVTAFLLPATFATASMTVAPGLTVKNDTDKIITIAVHYKSIRDFWDTTSFVVIPARQSKDMPVGSNNSVFYYY